MSGWLETARSVVNRWEIDNTEHFTVAFYFARLGDAVFSMLDTFGVAPPAAATTDFYVRFQRELRVGDIFHITTGVIDVTDDGLLLGHKMIDSGSDTLCTTIEQRLRVALNADARRKAEAHRIGWDGPKREMRPQPRGLEGFRDSMRDSVRPWEIDLTGRIAIMHYIHRFAGANGHATAVFGLTPEFYREQRRGFSTFEFQITVDDEARAGDLLVMKSAPLHVGNTSLRIFHQLLDARTGRRLATLDQLGVTLDLDARRPAPMPDWMKERARAALAPLA